MRAFSNELAPPCWASLSPWQIFSDSSSAYSKTSNDLPPTGLRTAFRQAGASPACDHERDACATSRGGFCAKCGHLSAAFVAFKPGAEGLGPLWGGGGGRDARGA